MQDQLKIAFIFVAGIFLSVAPYLPANPTNNMLAAVARKKASSSSSFFLETFDTPAGYDNSPSGTTGSPNPDYTTSPAPLTGAGESLRLPGSTDDVYWNFAGQSEVYARGMVHFVGSKTTTYVINLRDSSGNDLLRLRPQTNTTWQLHSGAGSTNAVITGWAADTTMYWWFYYKKGTGADSIARAWITNSTTKPGSPTMEMTGENETADAGRLRIYGGASATGTIYDSIELSVSDLGSF